MFNLFGGVTGYYASGGANDFIGKFETFEAAIEAGKSSFRERKNNNPTQLAWWHVTNSRMGIVASSEVGPYMYDQGIATEVQLKGD